MKQTFEIWHKHDHEKDQMKREMRTHHFRAREEHD
jgi:hypothetical protein